MSRFGRFHRAALERGVYLPPSQYEAVFLPAILTDDELGQIAASLSAAIAAA
jgi:glutamate-1-semialdehyde 2,1-aminomutase